MDPESDVTAESESTSEEAVSDPSESTSEEQSDGTGEAEPEGESEGEGESGTETESEGTETAEASADDQESDEYKNLVKKFAHIINPRDRNAAIGKAWWDKTNYAAQVRKENEDLKIRLARLESALPKEEEAPAPPPPDLAKVTQKIDALYQRDQQANARQGEIIKELNAADRELAIAEDRLKDVSEDDDRRPLAQARVRTAKIELEAARDRYSRLIDTRESYNERMEQLLAEKDFIERFHKDQALRQTSEQKRHENFNTEFPQQVERLTVAAANHIGLKLDEKLNASMWRHVNRALQADIRGQYLETPLEEVPIPEMVLAYVKEWAEDSELVRRKTFTKDSKEKLVVARPPAKPGDRKAPGTGAKPAIPASMRPAVPLALLSRDSSPVMQKARKQLIERLSGGR
jgi:hypothetical protein